MGTTTSLRPRQEVTTELPKAPPPRFNTVMVATVMLGILAASIWSIIELGITVEAFGQSMDNASRFLGRMFPLQFPPAGELIEMILETLAIVIMATALSVVLSLPLALWAASNTTTGPVARATSRTFIVITRAVPDLVLAIIFYRIFGFGAIPGILAMGIHSIGMVGKLYADAIEVLDNGPSEAIRASGGSRSQRIFSAILPQLMPQIIATGLHRFDINLRTSVLLGYVGVGGIGQAIAESLRTLQFKRGMALALVVLILCIVTELISGAIRNALLRGADSGRTSWADRISRNWFSEGKAGEQRTTPPWDAARISRFLSLTVLALILVASYVGSGINWDGARAGLAAAPQTMSQFWPPNTEPDILKAVGEAMLETIQIGLAATLLGAVLAVPVGILAARNVIRHKAVHTGFRVFIVLVRGIPELILAIVFIVIMGLGAVAGTMALAIGAVGLLSKLVADSLEETDVRVQEALRASGATPVQVFFAATLRQALPAFVAHVMYQLDVNIRSATLLGIVGAGGVGFLLLNAQRTLHYDVVTTIVLAILAVVLVVEALSLWVRRAAR